jgi:hypothetical protein
MNQKYGAWDDGETMPYLPSVGGIINGLNS